MIQVGRDIRRPRLPESVIHTGYGGNLEKIFCRHRVVGLEVLGGLNTAPDQLLS